MRMGSIKTRFITASVIVFILTFLLMAVPAAAAVEVDAADLTVTVNYEDLRDDDSTYSINHKITITNTGANTENLSFSLDDVPPDYQLSITPASIELAANPSQNPSPDITLSGTIPVNVDQGEHNIGTLKVSTAATDTTAAQVTTYTLKSNVTSMLELEEIDVYVNGQKEKNVDEDKESVKNLNPGDQIELSFTLENLFDSDYDEGTIDGDVEITLDDSSFGEDVDEEEDFEIDADEKEEDLLSLSFIVPKDVKEGDYTLNIKVEGRDENKARYETKWELELEVDREKDDLRIESFTVSPTEVTCSGVITTSAEVMNYGSNKQKDAALTIENTDLGINQRFDFSLPKGSSDDNSESRQVSINIPAETEAGTYSIVASSFYDFTQLTDKKTVDVVVKGCPVEETNETAEEEAGQTGETEQTEGSTFDTTAQQSADDENASAESAAGTSAESSKLTSSTIVQTIEDPYTASDVIVAMIIVAFVLILSLIVVFMVMLLRS